MGTSVLGKSFRSSRPMELCIIYIWCLHQLSVPSPVKFRLLLSSQPGTHWRPSSCEIVWCRKQLPVWKHHPFHGENPMKVRRASTRYLSFPSAPKCCKHMAIATVYLSAQFKNALQSVVVRGGLFSSMVNDWSQHNAILQHFVCNMSFSSFYSFSQILKKSQWKIHAENETSSPPPFSQFRRNKLQ